MTIAGKRDAIILFVGDIFIFLISLWLMLLIRYMRTPSLELFKQHLLPFSFLFIVWIIIFFIGGLYAKHTLVLKKKLSTIIFNAQSANIIIAALFFFLIPFFGISPKTNLFIYLFISFPLILWWRLFGQDLLTRRPPQKALLIGTGEEMQQLKEEINLNPKYGLEFDSVIDIEALGSLDFKQEVLNRVYSEEISVVVVDLKNEKIEPILPQLYNLLFAHVKFIDLNRIYEEIFDRVPLSFLRHTWFLENISHSPKVYYSFIKRLMDIVIAIVLGVLSLIVYPFVVLAIKLDDKGEIFSIQERIGQHNKLVKILKFRTMTIANDKGEWSKVKNEVTRVGKYLRNSRIDELPQLWNVIRGDLSLIGPRPEFPEPVGKYREQIPYYNVRHLIKPGLSGWAQIHHDEHPHHGLDIDETKKKLSYDLYYVKNKSLLLDINITLRTITTLLSRSGK
jgi:exopolysaccharide biosynthesis polyprenyl glycosylphosphotransferase